MAKHLGWLSTIVAFVKIWCLIICANCTDFKLDTVISEFCPNNFKWTSSVWVLVTEWLITVYIHLTPSQGARCDTRLVFLTKYSYFPFWLICCRIKVKEHCLFYNLLSLVLRKEWFKPFSKALARTEMQTDYISYHNNRFTKHASIGTNNRTFCSKIFGERFVSKLIKQVYFNWIITVNFGKKNRLLNVFLHICKCENMCKILIQTSIQFKTLLVISIGNVTI